MKSSIAFLLSLALLIISAHAADEAEWRTWTSSMGSQIEAKLVRDDGNSVLLQLKDTGRRLTVKLSQLSEPDQEYLKSLEKEDGDGFDTPKQNTDVAPTTVDGIDAKPGETSGEIECAAAPEWSYHLYLPKFFHTGKDWPVWFIMSPGGGKGGGALNRYKEGADKLGCILALSVQSKNGFDDSEVAMEAMAADVFERLPVIEGLGFASGFSGGSRMAYLLAERDKRVAGVLACGSGGGVYQKGEEFRHAKLNKSTYVCSLMGTNCFNRNEAVSSHEDFPDHFRLRFFEGGHDWADEKLIAEGMALVLGQSLQSSRVRDLDELKRDYARTMLTWAGKLQTDEPWEAAYWANFLAKFDGDGEVSSEAKELAGDLEKDDERVEEAEDAQKTIDRFCKKHFDKPGSSADTKKPDESRKAEADKLADKMGALPHADLLRKLGDPAR